MSNDIDMQRPSERELLAHVMRVDDIEDWRVYHRWDDDEAGSYDAYYTDDPPEWCREDLPDWRDVPYRTVYAEPPWVGPAKVLRDAEDGSLWDLAASFVCNGAAECPVGEEVEAHAKGYTTHDPMEGNDICPWCEAAKGEPHTEVFLDEGWCQLVYRKRVIVWGEDTFDSEDEVIEAALQQLDEVGSVTVGSKRYVFSLSLVAADDGEV